MKSLSDRQGLIGNRKNLCCFACKSVMLIYFAAGLFLAFLARSATKDPGTGHASVKADMATGGVNNARAAMHLSKYNHDPRAMPPTLLVSPQITP